jgi:hypothetical protein
VDAIRGGMNALTAATATLADSLRQVMVPHGAPEFATALPAPRGPMMPAGMAAAISPRLEVPTLPPPASPGVLPSGVAHITTDTRVTIDVNPSPLFDVKVRQGAVSVLREDKLRGRMGATGVADREGRR